MLARAREGVNESMSAASEPAPARDVWLLGLLAAGLLLRLGLIASGFGQPPARWEYDVLVENLLAGRGFVYEHIASVPYRAYYSGLPYVAALLACRGLTQSDLPVQLFQAALAVLSACCANDLARALAGRRAGLCAAGLSLFHPGLLYYDVAQIHPLGLDTALGLASLVALRRALLGTAALPSWLAGAVLGLGVLQRPTLLPFALVAPLILWRPGRRRQALLVWAAWLALVAPWLARNAVVLGRPVLNSTTAEHFWIGNAPASTGGSLTPDGLPVLAALPPSVVAELSRADELGQARVFRRLGFALVLSDPLGFARGAATKLARFWTLGPHVGLRYPRAWTFLHLAYYLPLLVLGALGAWRRRLEPIAQCLLAVCLGVSLVHACFYFEQRHRLALEPLLAVLATAAVAPARFDLPRRGCK